MFGIFNDDGVMVDGPFASIEEAEQNLGDGSQGETGYIAEECPEHEGQERECCEGCKG